MSENLEPIKQVIQIDVKESGVDEAQKSVGKLNTAISDTTKENKKSEDSFKSMKTQLREANAELQKAVQLHGETSEQAIKAAKGVAELKDQIGFAKDLSDQFNPDQKMKALGAATQLAATGIQGVTAGMALFGDQSEDTEKMLLKVQSAMAFSDAISGLADLGDQWTLLKSSVVSSSLATKANTAATGAAAMVQNLFTGSVNASGKGFKALKLAIAGTGIGLLVVGLALVVSNFEGIQKAVLKVVPGLATVGKFIGKIVDSVTDFVGVTSEADRAADRLKSNAEKRSKDIDRILKEDGSRYSESAKKKMAIEKQLQDDLAEGLYNEKKLRKEAAFAKAQIDKENAENTRKAAQENADKLASEAEARNEKAKEKAIASAKEIVEARKKQIEEEKKKQEEAAAGLRQFKIDSFNAEMEDKRSQDEQEAERLASITAVVDKIESDRAESQKAIDEGMLLQKEQIENAKMNIAEKGIALIANIFGKSKAVQKGAIIAENAIGIGKQIIANNTANAGALATPQSIATSGAAAAPVIALNNISTAIGVASTIAATTKALSAVGGGGASGGGGGSSSLPSRNIAQVGFQGSSENQISTAIAKNDKEQPPIQAFVVSQAMTDQQELDRKKVLNNSF